MQVVTFYPAYLQAFYEAQPGLAETSFKTQIDALLDDGFSGCHMVTRELAKRGFECMMVVANAVPAQKKWLAENDMMVPEPFNVALSAALQIQMFLPDAVYFTDVVQFDTRFLKSIPTRPKLVLGWRGFPFPAGIDLSGYDAIVSSFDRVLTEAPQFGARGVMTHTPGAIVDAASADTGEYDRDVIFSGTITSQHGARIAALHRLWQASLGADGGTPFRFELFMPDVSIFPPAMQSINRGAVWGKDMLRTMRRSKVSLNVAIDGYGQQPNMRVIETTGAGAFLLTDYSPEIANMFVPGLELETFRDTAEMITKIRHCLAHETERRAIAQAGRARCLKDHSLSAAVGQLHNQIVAWSPFLHCDPRLIHHSAQIQT